MLAKLIYENPLNQAADIQHFIAEGEPKITFQDGMILANTYSEESNKQPHFVLWLPQQFPADLRITWQFQPLAEPGLCMLFFAATNRKGGSIFDSGVPKRTGAYPEYHFGGINAYHLSYFRRKYEEERAFETCNLRKSHGFHLVAQGADPLPSVADARGFYHLRIDKVGATISFWINDLLVLRYLDEEQFGPVLTKGAIGFRQMAPMKARYKDLKVYSLEEER